jgi:hypothetical protein
MDRITLASRAVGLAAGMGVLFLFVLVVLAPLTFICVSLFHYDFVTVSSVVFLMWSLVVTGVALLSLRRLRPGLARINTVLGAVLAPLFIAQTMSLYQEVMQPRLSSAFNLVAWYRDLVSAPLHALARTVASLGPAGDWLMAWFDKTNFVGTVLSGIVILFLWRSLIGRFFDTPGAQAAD